MIPIHGAVLVAIPVLAAESVPPPILDGDVEAREGLGPWLESALRSTEAFGSWPTGPWRILLHGTDAAFEDATRSPGGRYALWIGSTLHLRPWLKLRRRDLGALLRHELTHRRLAGIGWPRWKEEAACLWAEGHTRLPDAWPQEPDRSLQSELDLALVQGSTIFQKWAYAWLRAWLEDRPLPRSPRGPKREALVWNAESSTEP